MSNRKVEYKDRVKSVDYLRIALNMVEIYVDYQTTYLLNMVLSEMCVKDEGKFSLDDACDIRAEWEQKFNDYFKKKDQQDEHNKRD